MSYDLSVGRDSVHIGAGVLFGEGARASTLWRVDRWDADQTAWVAARCGVSRPDAADFAQFHIGPYETSEVMGNLVTTAGWTRLMNLLTAQGGTQALDATHTRIGVGDATTPAEGYGDVDLAAAAGSTHRWFQPASGVGTLGTRTLSFQATFGVSDGNFSWNEFGIDVTSTTAAAGNTIGALLFNHRVGIAQGSKVSGQTWTATATLSFS
jgi:hypothetical protein